MTAPGNKKRRESRAAAPVRRSVEQRLLAYAAAASASLVSAQPASAKVTYTPINLTIETGTLPLDLNHDGVVDFNLVEKTRSSYFHYAHSIGLNVNGAGNPGAGVVASGSVAAMTLGGEIGPGEHFRDVRKVGMNMVYLDARSFSSVYYRSCAGNSQVGGVAPVLPTVSSVFDLSSAARHITAGPDSA